MKNRKLCALASSILLLLMITAKDAMALPWVTDNVQHWKVDLVCQDGAIVFAYNFNSGVLNNFGVANDFDATLQAKRLPGDFFTQAGYNMSNSEAQIYEQFGMIRPFGIDVEDYSLGDLGAPILLEATERPVRIFSDFGSGDVVNVYAVGFQRWDALQPVGSLVAIARFDMSFIVAQVADCRLPSEGDTWRVSVDENGVEGNGDSAESTISAHGMRIAFRSDADNLAVNAVDDNDSADIYLHTLSTNKTQLLSIRGSPSAPQAGGQSSQPAINYSGERIVFTSSAALFSFDDCTFLESDGQPDVYEWNYTLSALRRNVSVYRDANDEFCNGLDEANYRPAINQRDAVFTSDTPLQAPSNNTVTDSNGSADILRLEEMVSGTSVVSAYPDVQTSNGASDYATIATLQQWFAYETTATDLVSGGDSNGTASDIILTNSDTLTHRFMSVASDGTQANRASNHPAISGLANDIAFDSVATNLAPGVPNNVRQIYVRDLNVGCTTLLSQTAGGVIGNADSEFAAISANGRFVVFQSDASNLVPNDDNDATDIFLVDRDADEDGLFYGSTGCADVDEMSIRRVSLSERGESATGDSTEPDISANGAYISFTSAAEDIVANDGNGKTDIFVTFVGYQFLELPTPLAVALTNQQANPEHTAWMMLTVMLLSGLLIGQYRRRNV